MRNGFWPGLSNFNDYLEFITTLLFVDAAADFRDVFLEIKNLMIE